MRAGSDLLCVNPLKVHKHTHTHMHTHTILLIQNTFIQSDAADSVCLQTKKVKTHKPINACAIFVKSPSSLAASLINIETKLALPSKQVFVSV